MLRTLLNDAGCDAVRYTPQRLEDLLITAAYLLPLEVNFKSTYVVNVETRTITPNPINETDGEPTTADKYNKEWLNANSE